MQAILEEKEIEEEVENNFNLSEEFLRNFLANVQSLAIECIDDFFAEKELYCGGTIGEVELHSPVYISMVLNYDICSSVDQVYYSLDRAGIIDTFADGRKERFVSSILNQCARMGIPKCFAGGLLLKNSENQW
jgi:hypothetical protein